MEEIPAGVIEPHFSQRNIAKEDVAKQICERALKKAGIEPGPLTLLIPEGGVKVTIFDDFESLPSEPQHVRDLILHKLKKVLPFPSNEAALSYQILRKPPKPILLSVVIHNGILAQYYEMISGLGYELGCVDIPSFNLLAAINRMELDRQPDSSMLILNHDRSYISQTLISGGNVVLFRTKTRDLTGDPVESRLSVIIEDLLATARYYEDKISNGRPITTVIVRETTGALDALLDRMHTEIPSKILVGGLPELVEAGGEAPSPITAQILLPLIGAALR